MTPEMKQAIDALEKKLEMAMSQVNEIKKMINQLHEFEGQKAPYTIEGVEMRGTDSIAPDQFFGKGLATAVKEILKAKGKAMPVQDIFDLLTKGGYRFDGVKGELRLRALSISLSKNTTDFVRIPSEDAVGAIYGLVSFYPEMKKRIDKGKKTSRVPEEEESTDVGATSDEQTDSESDPEQDNLILEDEPEFVDEQEDGDNMYSEGE